MIAEYTFLLSVHETISKRDNTLGYVIFQKILEYTLKSQRDTLHLLECLKKQNQTKANQKLIILRAGEDTKRNSQIFLVGMQNSTATTESGLGISHKFRKKTLPYNLEILFLAYIFSNRTQNLNSHKLCKEMF